MPSIGKMATVKVDCVCGMTYGCPGEWRLLNDHSGTVYPHPLGVCPSCGESGTAKRNKVGAEFDGEEE